MTNDLPKKLRAAAESICERPRRMFGFFGHEWDEILNCYGVTLPLKFKSEGHAVIFYLLAAEVLQEGIK